MATLKRTVLCLLLLLPTSCGIKPPLAPDAGRTNKNLVLVPSQQTEEDPRALLAEVAHQYQQTEAIHTTILTWSTHNGKSASTKVEAYFQKTNRYRMTVLESTDTMAIGSKLVYTGGERCNVKGTFLGLPVQTSLGLSNARICTLRGDTLLDTGVERMMEILLDPNAKTKVLGHAILDSRSLTIVEVVSPHMLKNTTREVLFIDQEKALPSIREIYEGENPVIRCEFRGTVVNPEIPAGTFEMN